MTRVVFMGTPEFAVPSLRALIAHPDFDLVAVVTQPDRPAGRGQKLGVSAVKREAEQHSIPCFQPETLRTPEAVESLLGWQPDIIVVVAFGQILKQPVLDAAGQGCINVHASLLPRWRGAAPIQYAIRAGDTRSGITVMKMDAGLDSGPILEQQSIALAADETGASLHDKLAMLGGQLLPTVLSDYISGKIAPRPQPIEGITVARTLRKEEGQIDWSQSALDIDRLVRAFTPWPGAFTPLQGDYLKVHRGGVVIGNTGQRPGTIQVDGSNLYVQTGDNLYRLDEVQPAGKQRMSAQAFLAGRPGVVGTKFGKD